MYIAAPAMIGVLTPNEEIRNLGAAVLRIEAFAEPFYAASIVASGALRGAGDTLVPSCMNFASMWCVRIPLAAILAPRVGLYGVWIAMRVEESCSPQGLNEKDGCGCLTKIKYDVLLQDLIYLTGSAFARFALQRY